MSRRSRARSFRSRESRAKLLPAIAHLSAKQIQKCRFCEDRSREAKLWPTYRQRVQVLAKRVTSQATETGETSVASLLSCTLHSQRKISPRPPANSLPFLGVILPPTVGLSLYDLLGSWLPSAVQCRRGGSRADVWRGAR